MITRFGSVAAICVAALSLSATAAFSQENDPLAYSIAVRENACDDRRIEKAYFVEARRIAVECEGDEVAFLLGPGAGQAGALAAGAVLLLGAFASGGGGGSGSGGTSASTTGTN